MHVACTQENLLQGLSLVSHIAGKNSNLPILSHVLLKTEGGGLKLSATNLEMAVSAQVRGKIEAAGEFAVPVKLLQDYIALLPSGKVELVVQDDVLEIVSDGKKTTIKGMPSSEFPLLPKLVGDGGYKIEAEILREAIGQVVFAVSSSESRPELGGVACYFNVFGPGALVMAATDSYRLTERIVKLAAGNPTGELRCIVPAKAMQEAARILSVYKDEVATPEEVVWTMNESQLVMNYGSVELISRLIEGSFPDYRQIIPSETVTTAVVGRTELAKAIRAAALFARQGIFDVHLEILADGRLKIASSDSGTGTHSDAIQASVDGGENAVTVNFKYMTDGLSALRGNEVVIKLIDAMNPVLLQEKDGEDYRYIVMPIRQ